VIYSFRSSLGGFELAVDVQNFSTLDEARTHAEILSRHRQCEPIFIFVQGRKVAEAKAGKTPATADA